ncbi:MAG: hypothetical protein KDD63_08775 [Bacteroidetes bacterium]|nr:hypothetical protein [Bacteroidota bacterium]MCB0852301.1 hypothetical protein [Bacteroidota bacterium]
MESHTLKTLVEKYWRGETTLEEEKKLDETLAKDHSSDFEPLKEYRNFLQKQKEEQVLDDSFDLEIMAKLGNQTVRSIQSGWWIKVAAAIILILGIGLGGYLYSPKSKGSREIVINEDMTEAEARLAFEEVKKVLFTVSSNMNEGMEHTKVLGEFHKATLELEETTN